MPVAALNLLVAAQQTPPAAATLGQNGTTIRAGVQGRSRASSPGWMGVQHGRTVAPGSSIDKLGDALLS